MTNKLPKVGKRYRFKDAPSCVFTITFIDVGVEFENNYTTSFTRKNIEDFNNLEELPEDKAEVIKCINCGASTKWIKNLVGEDCVQCTNCTLIFPPEIKTETRSHISELSPEVKEAMEELKNISLKVTLSNLHYHEQYKEMRDKVDNLLNALDKQFKVNETNESVDVKEDKVKEKEESIWKPVSELGRTAGEDDPILTKSRWGEVSLTPRDEVIENFEHLKAGGAAYIKWCTLTDLINEHNEMKKRITKLENK